MKHKPFVFFLSSSGLPVPDEILDQLHDLNERTLEHPEYNHAAFLGSMVKVSAATPRRRRFWSRHADTRLLRLALQPAQ